jgi:hypothetical protein
MSCLSNQRNQWVITVHVDKFSSALGKGADGKKDKDIIYPIHPL